MCTHVAVQACVTKVLRPPRAPQTVGDFWNCAQRRVCASGFFAMSLLHDSSTISGGSATPRPPGTLELRARGALCLTRFLISILAVELCDMAFQCELMEDPVVASDGHTYDAAFRLPQWLFDRFDQALQVRAQKHSYLAAAARRVPAHQPSARPQNTDS